jgi:hypothetical protein
VSYTVFAFQISRSNCNRSWLFTATLVLVVGVLGDSGLTLVNSCKDAMICLDFFGEVDPHARQYSQISQSLLKITNAHAKRREFRLRQKRKEASSELFGLLQPSETSPRDPQLSDFRPGLLFTQPSGEADMTSSAPLDWTMYDADFFALPWPNENDQGLQDFLQPGTHNLDGASVADIPLFPIYDQHMGASFSS